MVRPLAALVVAVAAALAVTSAALAAFPGPYAVQGGEGVLSKDGSLRFIAARSAEGTFVSAISTKDQSVQMSRTFDRSLGVVTLTPGGPGEGLTRDGSALVLETAGFAAKTQFVVLRTHDLSTQGSFTLNGTFAFDALSPDASMLYLIQHKTVNDVNHYVVRAYNLRTHTLLSNRIADKTQARWIMQGWAASRAVSANGRWVYTLYANPGGYPFVHALDTVAGVAHCVGVPWPQTADQGPLFNFKLALTGNRLAVQRNDGGVYRYIDTKSWRVTKPAVR
jgi:hypothetical protein